MTVRHSLSGNGSCEEFASHVDDDTGLEGRNSVQRGLLFYKSTPPAVKPGLSFFVSGSECRFHWYDPGPQIHTCSEAMTHRIISGCKVGGCLLSNVPAHLNHTGVGSVTGFRSVQGDLSGSRSGVFPLELSPWRCCQYVVNNWEKGVCIQMPFFFFSLSVANRVPLTLSLHCGH